MSRSSASSIAPTSTVLDSPARLQGDGEWPSRGEVILDRPAADLVPYIYGGVVDELGPDELRTAFARLARRYAQAASYKRQA